MNYCIRYARVDRARRAFLAAGGVYDKLTARDLQGELGFDRITQVLRQLESMPTDLMNPQLPCTR